MKEKLYITTAIAYTSSKPHIGNVYEAILADCISRFNKKIGYDVYFQTGTDEHGQKIEKKAISNGLKPKEYVDNIQNIIKDTYKLVDIDYDNFVRTTDESHVKVVQKVFKKLYDKGDIYKGHYEGQYCEDCESFYTSKDLKDNCCPECGSAVISTKEEAYFFKLSNYQERLIDYINNNDNFIYPESRKHEMLNNFLNDKLPDLCVSRTSYKWGIEVPFDKKHVIYVWIDALLNYITGIGYDPDGSSKEFYELWPCDLHVIGKDILRFHTIYWPIILMALDIELPKIVFGHPWILQNHKKLSKSKNNIIYTDELVELFSTDSVRYFVLHDIPFQSDGNLTYELVTERHNSDLCNTLGNLVSRTLAMGNKYFNSKISVHPQLFDKTDLEMVEAFDETLNSVKDSMYQLKASDASESIIKLTRKLNKYIDVKEPWQMAKDDSKLKELENTIYILLDGIRYVSILFEPFIPSTSKKIYSLLNIDDTSFDSLVFLNVKEYNTNLGDKLFSRLDYETDILPKISEEEVVDESIISKPLINFEDFEKLNLVVGKITKAEYHPNSDNLLVLQVDIKKETRQIVSGVKKFYDPKDLIGLNVIVLENLKPKVIRKVESHGMIFCASDHTSSKLEIVKISSLEPGDIVS